MTGQNEGKGGGNCRGKSGKSVRQNTSAKSTVKGNQSLHVYPPIRQAGAPGQKALRKRFVTKLLQNRQITPISAGSFAK